MVGNKLFEYQQENLLVELSSIKDRIELPKSIIDMSDIFWDSKINYRLLNLISNDNMIKKNMYQYNRLIREAKQLTIQLEKMTRWGFIFNTYSFLKKKIHRIIFMHKYHCEEIILEIKNLFSTKKILSENYYLFQSNYLNNVTMLMNVYLHDGKYMHINENIYCEIKPEYFENLNQDTMQIQQSNQINICNY